MNKLVNKLGDMVQSASSLLLRSQEAANAFGIKLSICAIVMLIIILLVFI